MKLDGFTISDIIIAGAPRCGTTALFNYLTGHPQIVGSKVKEACYFIDEGYFSDAFPQYHFPRVGNAPLATYAAYFPTADSKALRLESTPDYLYQTSLIAFAKQHNYYPKLIFTLRAPEERVYSFYKFAQENLLRIDKDLSFDQFVAQIDSGNTFRQYNNIRNILAYSNYAHYLKRYYDAYPNEKIKVIIFEDFLARKIEYMQDLCHFLAIDPHFYDDFDFQKSNESYAVKSRFLQKIAKTLPLPRALRYQDNRLKSLIKQVYFRFNTAPKEQRSEADEATLNMLRHRFKAANKELSQTFKLDISAWQIRE